MWPHIFVALATTFFIICVHLSLSQDNGRQAKRCENEHVTLQGNETVVIETSHDEACNFTMSISKNKGIHVDIAALPSWSIYDYFLIQDVGEDCWNGSFAWTGSSSMPCKLLIPCDCVSFGIRSSAILQIRGVNISQFTPFANLSTVIDTNDQFTPGNILTTCDFTRYDAVHYFQYLKISYSELTIRIPSLQITFPDPNFHQDELPNFDLSTPDYIQLSEFPPCRADCSCGLQFQWFLEDCPDAPATKTTFLVYQLPKTSTTSFALDISDRQLSYVLPNSLANLTDILFLLLSHNEFKTIECRAFDSLMEIHTLDLSFNKLVSLCIDSFVNMYMLRHLVLSENKLSNVSHKLFHSLVNLQVLYLSGNSITQLEPSMFIEIPNLQILSITKNYLSEIQNVSNSLLVLDISLNEFTSLPFDLPRELAYLSLEQNHFVLINNFSLGSLNLLISLDLSHNDISFIPSNLFSTLQSLQHLYLDFNKLYEIDVHAFNGLSGVSLLILCNNFLETLKPGTFRDLHQL